MASSLIIDVSTTLWGMEYSIHGAHRSRPAAAAGSDRQRRGRHFSSPPTPPHAAT